MFTSDDAIVFSLPDNYKKLDEIGNAYFPQLSALLIKANSLILDIYDFQPNDIYNVYLKPAPSKIRRDNITFNSKRTGPDQALVGLKAKGIPTNLTKPNGSACDMHSASLSFGIVCWDDEVLIASGFNPYSLKYAQKHRDDLSGWIKKLNIEAIFRDFNITFQDQSNFGTVPDLLRKHGAQLLGPYSSGINPSFDELAMQVIIFAGMFPMLDVFTRLSNNQDVQEIDYASKFVNWRTRFAANYISNFSIEPVKPDVSRISEGLVRNYFESLLGCKFPTLRPPWLKSPKTESNLELDGYCEALNLAFEYQGEYHYMPVVIHHQHRTLEEVKEIDALKVKLCKKRGVDLIQIPYWKKNDLLFIKNQLFSLDRHDINQILNKNQK